MTMTLVEKLAKAAEACRYLQKDKRNQAQSYNYVSDQAVTHRAMSALAAEGVVVVHSDVSVEQHLEVPTRNGSARYVLVKARIELGDGDKSVVFHGLGSGMDSGDKAVMKAVTAARKYALLVGLGIASGDDPEADESTDKATQAAPAQQVAKPAAKAAPKAEKPAPRGTAEGNEQWGLEAEAPQAEVTPAMVIDELAACELSAAALRAWYVRHRDRVRAWPKAEERALLKAMLSDRCREAGIDVAVITAKGQ